MVSPVTAAISESVQILFGEPQDIAFSSGMVLKLSTLDPANASVLITLPFLSVIIAQLAAEVNDEDIILRPVIGPHAMVVEMLLKQSLATLRLLCLCCFRIQIILSVQ